MCNNTHRYDLNVSFWVVIVMRRVRSWFDGSNDDWVVY
jgi:hypothetical protein